MAKKEDIQADAEVKKTKVKTITREFEGYGRFTVRGSLGGEKIKIQSDATVVDTTAHSVDVDGVKSALGEIDVCLLDSPKGPHPGIPYLAELLSGVMEALHKDIKSLSTPKSKIIKN